MKAASNGKTAVVELLLSKGANTEAANKVMIPNYWLKFILFTGFRCWSGQNNHNIYEYSNNRKCGNGLPFETFVGVIICPNIMQMEWETKVLTTEGRTHECVLIFPMRPSVCLVLFFATADIYFIYLWIHIFIYVLQLVGLDFRCFCSFRFIYLMIFVWKLPECAVSWTLYFH